MKGKRRFFLILFLLFALGLAACSRATTEPDSTESGPANTTETAVSPAAASNMTANDAESGTAERPVNWNEVSHSNDADPDYAVVFPEDTVNSITLTIDPDNWQAMQDDMTVTYGEPGTGNAGGGPAGGPPAGGGPGQDGAQASSTNPIWIEGTLTFNDSTWTHVGIRFKGNSSLMSTWSSGNEKLSFKLDFDEFEDSYPEIDNQRFYGFKQLNLNNNFDDSSFLREAVASDLFREAGLVAAETAFYELYVDYGDGPVYFGLYTMVEEVDDTVIETQFSDDSGNLYKPDGVGASFAEGTFDEATFDKKSNEADTDWSDIEALFAALHSDSRTSDPAAWRNELESVFDVDTFLNWLAVNTVVQNWDTYGQMTHNYYLYNNPETGLLTWIPWDNNEALQAGKREGALSLSLDEVGDNWPLIRYLMDDPVYQEIYSQYVNEFTTTLFTPEKMTATYMELAELVEPYATAENAEHTFLRSPAEFNSAIQALISHVNARVTAVSNLD